MKKFNFILVIFSLIFFITTVGYSATSGCEKEGTVKLSYSNYNVNMNLPADLSSKKITVGVMCQGFQTSTIGDDNITTCHYDPDTISCYVSTDSLWLNVPDSAITCNSNFDITLNLEDLVLDTNVSNYTGNIKVSCSNGFHSAEDTSTITLSVNLDKENLTINPSNLFWSIVQLDNGTVSYSPQIVKVSGAAEGISYEIEGNWLDVSVSNDNQTASTYIIQITPKEEFFKQADTGIYNSSIKIYDKMRKVTKSVPITVQVRDTDNPILITALYQDNSFNSYFIEVSDAEKYNFNIDISSYFNQLTVGQDISGLKTYVVFYFPDIIKNYYWAYVPTSEEVFKPIEINNVYVSDADNLYYGKGKVEQINIGPYLMRGLKGNIDMEVRVGNSYATSVKLLYVNTNIYNLFGDWELIDEYEGTIYDHPETLKIWQENNDIKGCFYENGSCKYSVGISYGNGNDELYHMMYSINGYYFDYSIQKISSNSFEGKWKWCDAEGCHDLENFVGLKNITLTGQ